MDQYSKTEPKSIKSLFNRIASRYDRANALMSLNCHKKWNKVLVREVLKACHPDQYLDLCAGTGEIAFTLLKQCLPRSSDNPSIKHPSRNSSREGAFARKNGVCETFLLDFSEEMLKLAQAKASLLPVSQKVHYIQADAQKIPLPGSSIDAVTIAYGIRNIEDPSRCIQEVYRVLRPGGVLAILELTRPNNPIMKMGHKLYTKLALPLIGKVVASDRKAYQYLCSSVQEFLHPVDIARIIEKSGFSKIRIKPLFSGVATVITAKKIIF